MGSFSRTVNKIVGKRNGRMLEVWNFDSKSDLLVAPTIADINGDGLQEIIIGTTKGELIVLDNQSKELWRYKIQESLGAVEEMFLDQTIINSINAAPVVADFTNSGQKHIIFGSESGIVYCLNAKGALVWKFKTGGGIRGSPLLADINDDGKLEIVIGSIDTHLYLLTAEGKLIEKFEQEAAIESTPGFAQGIIFFGMTNGSIVALKPSGELKWTFKTEGRITAAPAFARLTKEPIDYVIIGSEDNNLYCLDVDGELVWKYKTNGAIYSQAAVADLNNDNKLEIIIGSCDNNIHAITADGERYWSYETDFWVVGTPLIIDIDGDGKPEVVAGSYDHYLYILDSEGSYVLDYVPGLSGVVQQAGNYSEIMTQEPGQHIGKKIWQYKTAGVILGCTAFSNGRSIIVTTKKGMIDDISHQE
jgi:outer membrane protein assembly factor BamB